MQVAFVPPREDLPRRAHVDFVRDRGDSTYEVGFREVADEATAHGLVGCHCLVRREDIDESAFEEEPAAWVGWEVVQVGGEAVGAVESLVENPGQSLLEVRRADGTHAYIPVVDEIVCDVDVSGRVISVELPAGLLEL